MLPCRAAATMASMTRWLGENGLSFDIMRTSPSRCEAIWKWSSL
jgi:hypothetical protein